MPRHRKHQPTSEALPRPPDAPVVGQALRKRDPTAEVTFIGIKVDEESLKLQKLFYRILSLAAGKPQSAAGLYRAAIEMALTEMDFSESFEVVPNRTAFIGTQISMPAFQEMRDLQTRFNLPHLDLVAGSLAVYGFRMIRKELRELL